MTDTRPADHTTDRMAVAMRAVRHPDAAVGAALSSVVDDAGAELGAVYLLADPAAAETGGVELLAAAGPAAMAVGRLGPVSAATAEVLRRLATGSLVHDAPPAEAVPEPFRGCTTLGRLSGPLPEAGAFVAVVGGPTTADPGALERDAADLVPFIAMAALDLRAARLKALVRELRQSRIAAIATLRHDAAAPLTSIQGAAEALLRSDLDTEARQRLLELIRRQASRIRHMVSDPWDVDDSGPVRLVAVDLRAVLEKAVAAAVLGRSIEVEQRVEHRRIVTDPERLERAVVNLLDNARKYSPAGAAVMVHTEDVPGGVEVTVADRGPGVDPALVPALFTSYAGDAARPDSNGLGLRSVSVIADQLGGRITYARQAGWSRFTLFLPDLVGSDDGDGDSGA